jgi:hypothetical protein
VQWRGTQSVRGEQPVQWCGTQPRAAVRHSAAFAFSGPCSGAALKVFVASSLCSGAAPDSVPPAPRAVVRRPAVFVTGRSVQWCGSNSVRARWRVQWCDPAEADYCAGERTLTRGCKALRFTWNIARSLSRRRRFSRNGQRDHMRPRDGWDQGPLALGDQCASAYRAQDKSCTRALTWTDAADCRTIAA